jgi:hypothetical protein
MKGPSVVMYWTEGRFYSGKKRELTLAPIPVYYADYMTNQLPMPDLSALSSLKKNLLAILIGMGDAGLSRKLGLHRRNFIRLIDKAIYEYVMARADVLAEMEETEPLSFYGFAFIDHMENCINATRRLLAMVEIFKSERTPILPRETRLLLRSLSQEIIDVRDVIEHMDERVQQDRIGDKESVMLAISTDRDTVTIGGDALDLVRLSETLRRLHHVGITLLELSPKKWP